MLIAAKKLYQRWFPSRVTAELRKKTDILYASNCEYHEMTREGDKTLHPQVMLLMALVGHSGNYLEVGCGCGSVCRIVGNVVNVTGIDVSPIALQKASETCRGGKVKLQRAEAENLPFDENIYDGIFSFEFLEHSWRPEAALKEMVRVLKPGGFLLLSAPNGFSLDMHLTKRASARFVEYVLAACRFLLNQLTGKVCVPVAPNLGGAVYPDCDMVSALNPENVAAFLERHGMHVEFWDTTYMCAQREGSSTNLDFQRLCVHPFFRHFGDHILMLARKRTEDG